MRQRSALLLVVFVFAVLLLPIERVDTGARPIQNGPFTLTVGQYYILFATDNRQVPSDRNPVLALRSYPNGWIDVKTLDDQVLTINMTHLMHVARIEDIEKWRKNPGK
jgi:hypothetical protein